MPAAGRPEKLSANDRTHFFRIASRVMRQILVDHGRKRNAQKRGGGVAKTSFYDYKASLQVRGDEMIALDDALAHPRHTWL